MTTITVTGLPISKPRMSRSDVWKKRACVVEYRAWADRLRRAATGDPTRHLASDANAIELDFVLPAAPSTPKSKLKNLQGQPHRTRPDVDNLSKAVMDALFENDSCIASLKATKRYCCEGEEPHVEIVIHQRPMDMLG